MPLQQSLPLQVDVGEHENTEEKGTCRPSLKTMKCVFSKDYLFLRFFCSFFYFVYTVCVFSSIAANGLLSTSQSRNNTSV